MKAWHSRIGLLLSVSGAAAPACGGRSQGMLADGGTTPDPKDAHPEAAVEAGQGAAGGEAGDDAGSGAAGDTGAADEGGDLAPGCSSYCDAILAACRRENAQYKDHASCMNACKYMSSAAPGPSGGTLACRAAHAASAMTTPNPHCWNAGPLGYGACGPPYEGFCQIAAGRQQTQAGGLCSGVGGYEAGAPVYSSNADCLLRAAGYALVDMPTNVQQLPGTVGLDGGFSANGPATGDTLDCRAYHLLVALQGGVLQQVECANVGRNSPACH